MALNFDRAPTIGLYVIHSHLFITSYDFSVRNASIFLYGILYDYYTMQLSNSSALLGMVTW